MLYSNNDLVLINLIHKTKACAEDWIMKRYFYTLRHCAITDVPALQISVRQVSFALQDPKRTTRMSMRIILLMHHQTWLVVFFYEVI